MEKNFLQVLLDLLNYQFLSLPLYKILIAFLAFFFFLFARKFFTLIIFSFLKKAVSKTKTELDDKLLHAVRNPLRFLFIVAGIYFLFPSIQSIKSSTLFWGLPLSIALMAPVPHLRASGGFTP